MKRSLLRCISYYGALDVLVNGSMSLTLSGRFVCIL